QRLLRQGATARAPPRPRSMRSLWPETAVRKGAGSTAAVDGSSAVAESGAPQPGQCADSPVAPCPTGPHEGSPALHLARPREELLWIAQAAEPLANKKPAAR